MSSVVLVHGSGAGSWQWARVRLELEAAGVRVDAPDLPSVGDGSTADVHGDAAMVRSVLDALDEPALVCAHSYGGFVATQACAGPHPEVSRLVYLAAFVPDVGDTMLSLLADHPADPELDPGLDFNNDGTFSWNADGYARVKTQLGWDQGEAEDFAHRLRPQSMQIATQTCEAFAWKELRTLYVSAQRDETLVPSARLLFGSRTDTVVEIDSDHDAMWSTPRVVADILLGAVTSEV